MTIRKDTTNENFYSSESVETHKSIQIH